MKLCGQRLNESHVLLELAKGDLTPGSVHVQALGLGASLQGLWARGLRLRFKVACEDPVWRLRFCWVVHAECATKQLGS